MKEKFKYILKVMKSIAVILGYIILSVLLNEVLKPYLSDYLNLLVSLIIICILLFVLFHKKIITDIKNFKRSDLKEGFKYWLIGFIVMLILNNILINIYGGIAANEEGNRSLIDAAPLYSILYMTLFAPFAEEICFRLNLRNLFSKSYTYIITSGLIFGYMHTFTDNILFILPYAILGGAFALMHYKTNNILTSIIMHIFHNTLSIAIIILGGLI